MDVKIFAVLIIIKNLQASIEDLVLFAFKLMVGYQGTQDDHFWYFATLHSVMFNFSFYLFIFLLNP